MKYVLFETYRTLKYIDVSQLLYDSARSECKMMFCEASFRLYL